MEFKLAAKAASASPAPAPAHRGGGAQGASRVGFGLGSPATGTKALRATANNSATPVAKYVCSV
jgi:chorismate mutase